MARAAGICGVVLAAGASSRMGRDKALLPWPPVAEGTPATNTFLGAMIDLLQSHCDLVLVIAGQNADNLQLVADAHNAFLVINPHPERGQFSSIQTGSAGGSEPRPRRRVPVSRGPPAGPARHAGSVTLGISAIRTGCLGGRAGVFPGRREATRSSHSHRSRHDGAVPARPG